MEKQGGTIHVKSKIDHGSAFSFTLNFKKQTTLIEVETVTEEPKTNIKNINILVVEDIKLHQLLISTILDDFNFNHNIADNGKIAIEKLEAQSYDIILMDLQMPEMNGFEKMQSHWYERLHSKAYRRKYIIQ